MAGNQKRFWRFQLTAARRRLGAEAEAKAKAERVSTHSRPKAAGAAVINTEMIHESFNSQPPEGGWSEAAWLASLKGVSTHSRPKAAGKMLM